MNFIQLQFFVFLIVTWFLYYITPQRFRWGILLAASTFFYLMVGWKKLIFVLATCLITYVISNRVDYVYNSLKNQELDIATKKAKAKLWSILGIVFVIIILVYAKVGQELVDAITNYNKGSEDVVKIIIPLGISYYSFGLIGYITDLYWRKDNAERNPLKLLLFMIYFPQILQGPIPRHKRLTEQLLSPRKFDNRQFSFGVQRMLWGYFKKMVIADRFAIIVNTVYNDYRDYKGQIFIAVAIFSVIQIYCDFSGCMDIAIGISETFGITLDENFNRPFFSKTVAEFWRRWHMTLSEWFKDYLFLPISRSNIVKKSAKKMGNKFGPAARKKTTVLISSLVVWLATGLWHGTGLNYILWGCYWGILINVSNIFDETLQAINDKLGINTASVWWKRFQMIRTFAFFSIARIIAGPGDLAISGYALKSMFTIFNPNIWFDRTLFELGVDRQDFWIGISAVLLLWFISIKQEQGVKIRETIASFPLPIRWLVYYGAFFAVIIFGIYGPNYNASDFVYMNF